MSRLDKLSDPYEGSLTATTIKGISAFLRQVGYQGDWGKFSEFYRQRRAKTYVCCWHANENESEAMWRLYCSDGRGVAIQTTYANLVRAIENEYDLYVGCVKYIDYEQHGLRDANPFWSVMHKRASFSHEREVRLVTSPPTYETCPPEAIPESHSIPWDVETMIECVYVDPYAPEYFFEAVQAVVTALAPSFPSSRLQWSQMKAAPLF
jgi:hypothetical protein